MDTVAIVGSGSLSERLIYYFESTGFASVAGMFDDFEKAGSLKYDRPILGSIDEIPALFRKGAMGAAIVAVGYTQMRFRREVFERLRQWGIPLATFVHPTSHVEGSATVGEGSIVLVDCTLDTGATLHENVFLGSRGFLSHDVTIHPHTYCGPAVNLAGHTEIGECCFVGVGTTSIDGIKTGSFAQTAAGAVLTRDVPSGVLVAGVPAEVKKSLNTS